MRNQFTIPQTITDWFWFILASFFTIGGSAGFWSWLQNRRKTKAETHESQARTRNLDVQSSVSAGDLVLRYIDRLSNAQVTIDGLHRELAEWRELAEKTESLRAANSLLERQLYESEVQRKYWEEEARRRR